MVSKTKLYNKLDSLECYLKDSLTEHLQSAISANNDLLFCAKQFNTITQFKSKTDKKTEELIELGSEVLGLREKLGEANADTIAARLCWYCRQWSQSKTYNKNLGIELAIQFLDEIV